jgi:uncharacterized protein YkwD
MRNLFVLFLLPLFVSAQPESADPDWYTSLAVDSFFNATAALQIIDIQKADVALIDMAVFFATNEQRLKRKLPAYRYHPTLREAALFHSIEMRDKRFFSHINKGDRENREPEQRIKNKGGESFTAFGENIIELPAYKLRPDERYDAVKNPDGTFTFLNLNGKPLRLMTYGEFGRAVVKLWMSSPDHKANVMSKDFTHLGCGSAFDEEPFQYKTLPQTLITQNFARISD